MLLIVLLKGGCPCNYNNNYYIKVFIGGQGSNFPPLYTPEMGRDADEWLDLPPLPHMDTFV